MATSPKTKAAKPAKPAKTVAAKKTASAKKAAPQGACLNPYLIFNGDCAKAFKVYEKVFGSKIECLYRMKDMPPSAGKVDAKHRNRVLHLMLPVGSLMLMGADGCPNEPAKVGDNVQLSVCAPDAAEAKRIFKALSAKGKVVMALTETFWAELYGVTVDRFGVTWMVQFRGNAGKK